jgi:hypothetical protein
MRAARLFMALTIVVLLAGAGSARAEFQLAGSAASIPAHQSAPSSTESDGSPARTPTPARRGRSLAQGFGHQVPLAFAVRQIVPASVRVRFGDGIDADDLLVDWKGGRPWPDVLRGALRPPGLQVTFRPNAVLIERASPS